MPPKKKSSSSGIWTRSAANNSRSIRQMSERSSRNEKTNQQGDIVDMFNQFKDVFDDESRSIESEESTSASSKSGSSSSSSSCEPEEYQQRSSAVRNVATSRSEEMPPWAKRLLESQQKALESNNKKLRDLRKEIRSLKRKRSKDDDGDFDWKKKGHKKQFEFNKSIEDQFEEIASANQLLTCRMAAEKGLKLINKRNKLLKIADTHGWDTVNQYEADPLAANEEDDRKLRKAIKDASKAREKVKAEKEAKARRASRARAFCNKESALSPARLGPPVIGNAQRDKRVVLPAVDRSSRYNVKRLSL